MKFIGKKSAAFNPKLLQSQTCHHIVNCHKQFIFVAKELEKVFRDDNFSTCMYFQQSCRKGCHWHFSKLPSCIE